MLDFYQTNGGRRFVDATVPHLSENILRLAKATERANELKEIEMGIHPAVDIKALAKEQESGHKNAHDLIHGWCASHAPDLLHLGAGIRTRRLEEVIESLRENTADAESLDESIEDEVRVWITENVATIPYDGRAHRELEDIVRGIVKRKN